MFDSVFYTLIEDALAREYKWEAIELNERIGGFRFAKACLAEAWQKRKEVNE